MPLIINAPGNNLPYPQSLYPQYSQVTGAVGVAPGTNQFSLAPGSAALIPAGVWSVYVGKYCTLQIFDPIWQTWLSFGTTQLHSQIIRSDGVNYRVANLTGCAIGASITNAGSGYTSNPTVTASAGGSQWVAIVGGALTTSPVVTFGGSGYTVPPALEFAAPGGQGIPASGYAVLTNGVVTSVVITNQGAGYTSVPPITVVPNPADPNIAGITNAVITAALTGSGEITAIICTDNGAPVDNQAATPTLTISGGGGNSAAATVNMCWMVSAASATGGTGYLDESLLASAGGRAASGTVWGNPICEIGILSPPRPIQGTVTASGGVVSSASIVDGGLFAVGGTDTSLAPVGLVLGGVPTAVATVSLTLGSQYSEFYIQPL